jgi:hypothetical protein
VSGSCLSQSFLQRWSVCKLRLQPNQKKIGVFNSGSVRSVDSFW